MLAAAFRNRNLRDIGSAYALFSASEFGVWIILLVFAFDRGGISAELLITVIQLLPCVLLAPAIGALADRLDPARALLAGYGIQAITIGGVALALAFHAPSFVIYLLAPFTALSMCMTRPPQSALLPSVVRTPDELTSANVMTVWTEGAAALIGPAIAGILLASSGQTTAMAAMAGLNILSMLLVLRAMLSLGPITHHSENSPDTQADSFMEGVRGNLVRILMNPHIRVLLHPHHLLLRLGGIARLPLRRPCPRHPPHGPRRRRIPERRSSAPVSSSRDSPRPFSSVVGG